MSSDEHSKDEDEDEDVGYRKPPKSARFQKGQSGNPRGRPKGQRNYFTDLDEVLKAPVTIVENGKPRRVSTRLAALLALRKKALGEDLRALVKFLDLASQRSAELSSASGECALNDSEEDILRRFTETIKQELASLDPDANGAERRDHDCA